MTEYDYSSQGRLKQVVTPQHTVEYRHIALGNRVAKLVDGQVVEKYLWQDKTTLLATYDGSGNLKQRFEYTDGNTPTTFTQNGERYYILTDQLGSPRVIADEQGNAVRRIEYDAYGNVIADTNPDLEIPFGFAGGLKDEHTGLIRFGYRDYDPATGRWTAPDPIGFAGGDPNLYGYVLGDPVNWVDPHGLESVYSQGEKGLFVQGQVTGGTGRFGGKLSVTISDTGITLTGGAGPGIGIGATLVGGIQTHQGNTDGISGFVSGSAGKGPGVAYSGSANGTSQDSAASNQFGIGIGVGAGMAAGTQYSKTILWDEVIDFLILDVDMELLHQDDCD